MAVPVLCASDKEGCFAIRVYIEQRLRRAEWGGGVAGGIAGVEDEAVFYAQLFQKPEDTLGLRVLGYG